MKRIFAFLLMLMLMLTSASCIRLTPVLPTDTDTDTTDTDPETDTEAEPSVDAPAWPDAATAAKAFFEGTAGGVVDIDKREYSYEEMVADLAELNALYPTRFSYRSFGQSVAGRELYVAVLGNPNAEQQLLVSAGIHGREYLTPLLVMKQMEFTLAHYENGDYNGIPYSTLFENCCLYVVP